MKIFILALYIFLTSTYTFSEGDEFSIYFDIVDTQGNSLDNTEVDITHARFSHKNGDLSYMYKDGFLNLYLSGYDVKIIRVSEVIDGIKHYYPEIGVIFNGDNLMTLDGKVIKKGEKISIDKTKATTWGHLKFDSNPTYSSSRESNQF